MVETFSDSVRDKQSVKDQIGDRDSTTPVLDRWKTEEMNVYDANCLIESNTIGTAFVLGHSTNGKLGGSLTPQPVLGNGTSGGWTTVQDMSTDQKITDAGVAEIAGFINSESVANPSHVGMGTGSTTFNVSQTALTTEVSTRKVVTYNNSSTGVAIFTTKNYYDITQSGVQEFGLFNASASGDMFARRVCTSFNMATTSLYRVTWTINIDDI